MSEATNAPDTASAGSGGKGSGKGGKGAPAVSDAPRSGFHVVGPSSVIFEGKNHPAGASLQLTEADAESLGAAVAPGKAPPPPEDIAERSAGKYRVADFGSVVHGGQFRAPGTLLELTESDARTLGAAVVAAR